MTWSVRGCETVYVIAHTEAVVSICFHWAYWGRHKRSYMFESSSLQRIVDTTWRRKTMCPRFHFRYRHDKLTSYNAISEISGFLSRAQFPYNITFWYYSLHLALIALLFSTQISKIPRTAVSSEMITTYKNHAAPCRERERERARHQSKKNVCLEYSLTHYSSVGSLWRTWKERCWNISRNEATAIGAIYR